MKREKILNTNSKKLLINLHPNTLTERLWKFILSLSGLDNPQLRYCDLSPKAINRLIQILCASIFHINGRAAFKEEFVTCGGVNLSSIKLKSLESKLYPGLYFAGEILDIDAITGGFNLQAAWTTAFVVAKNLVK